MIRDGSFNGLKNFHCFRPPSLGQGSVAHAATGVGSIVNVRASGRGALQKCRRYESATFATEAGFPPFRASVKRRYRLIVQRDGKRVRVWTRNGHDWSDRFPLISEAALRNRNSNFVIDGEAVLLGVDGRSDFNGLHSRKHDDEVQFYAFDMLVSDGEDLRKRR